MTQELCAFIDDGYTRPHTIESDGVNYPTVKFEFRPMLETEIQRMNVRLGHLDAKKEEDIDRGEEITAEIMARHVKLWDLKNRDKQIVPITMETMLRIERHLAAEIFKVITGQVVGKPETSQKN